ncbi:MAG: hypothetical protein P9F19_08420 [Candidatus Contendobacter sp.]|nr:hypothetical protein [Candidatus Contendobacter sp.]MDG4557396.1 hypothetical protein [Candidatus Contendobacter sp.]
MLASDQQAQLWFMAWRGLHYLDSRPAVSSEMIQELVDVLPELKPGQTIGDWLNSAKVRRRVAITEFVRMAASSSKDRYPLPTTTLPSSDGRFWLTVQKSGDELKLTLEAIGLAIGEFAGHQLVLTGPEETNAALAIIQLDHTARGYRTIPDTVEHRRMLLHPRLSLPDAHEP